ncbi:MAG: MBL fold metallo-hydrolase [Pseudomonadales bacterium]
MKKRASVLPAFVAGLSMNLAGCAQSTSTVDPADVINPEVAAMHVKNAKDIAGKDLALPAKLLCMPGRQTIDYMIADGKANPPEEPYKVFDNLYVIGGRAVTAWAITTSEGIILIDSMGSRQEAKDYIVAGLEKMGLDPADIKTILVAHGHGDHYGGAVYLRDTYGARIAMSDVDWKFLEAARSNPKLSLNPKWGPGPERDITLEDGQKFTLGDTTIDIVLTPGHTMGTISFVIPVTDDGVQHSAALWGGTGQPPAGPRSVLYEESLKRFAQITDAAEVDTVLSNHPLVDGTIDKLTRLRADPEGPNPFIVGEATYKRYLSILNECLLAARARPPSMKR